ncbi:MAG: SLC13 family permease [Bacillota bacterium]
MVQVDPTQIPLLAGLPRVALARLVPELGVITCTEGEQMPIPEPDQVYLVTEGEIECTSMVSDQVMPIYALTPGDIVARPTEEQVISRTRYLCLTPVRLVTVPRKRLEELAHHYPDIAKAMNGQLSSQLNRTQLELLRTRRLLGTYAQELWGSVPTEDAAVAEMAPAPSPVHKPPAAPKETPERDPKARALRPAWFGILVNVVVILGLWFVMPPQASPAYYLLAVFVLAGVNWALATLPDHVVALAAAFVSVVMGIATLEGAFGGFSSASWWILLAVLGVVVPVTRTGLLYRAALVMLRVLPPTHRWQALALTLTGIAMTPCVPNGNARVSILAPLATELSDAMQLPLRSKGSTALAMATYLGAGQIYFLFLNGAPMTIILWSILPPDIKGQVSWGSWFLAALPMGLTLLIGFLALLFFYYRPESAKPISRSTVALQQAVLGPVTRQEWLLVAVVSTLLLGFITEPWHGISATWLAVGIFLFLMGSGLLDKQGLKQVDWSLTIYMGAVISLSSVAQSVGLNQTLTDMIAPWVMRLHLSATPFLMGVAILTILFRLAVPPPVVTVVLTVALEPVARVLGVSPFAVGLTVVTFCSSWLVPQQWSVFLSLVTSTNERCFTPDQVKGLAWANNLLLMLGLLAGIPLWRSMGLMP